MKNLPEAPIKILIIDDEEDILEFLQYNLKRENFEIITCKDSLEAYDLALNVIPDLILLDVMMPEMDGIELCTNLRENTILDDTLIAFLTARDESFTQVSALEAGGDDFIVKPIRPNVLKSRVKALLRRHLKNRSTQNEANTAVFGNLTINFEEYNVRVKKKEIQLARKEFQLLSLLASKPGKVFHRQDILNHVWGSGVIVGDRTIDVHIRKLREKIGKNFIQTYKGVGYKFDF